jgi:cation diffusion facilitator family transporter
MTLSAALSLDKLTPQRLLLASVAATLLTMAFKTGAWWLTGSVGLLADAMESLVNLSSAMFEYFSSGFEGALIVVAAAAIVWAAWPHLWEPQPLQRLDWGLGLSVVSSAINGGLAWVMLRAARHHRSIALEADGRHLITDVWTSVGVVLGIAAVWLTGWLWLDAVVAIAMALNILREGFKLLWRSSQGLMDEAIEPEAMAQVHQTLAKFAQPTVRFDHLSSRRSGQRNFLYMHMHMPPDWSLRRAAALRGEVEQALMAEVPGLRATIELLPSDVEAHIGDHVDQIEKAKL